MTIKSDIEIAQEAQPLPITDIADACGVDGAYVEQYGRYKAKIDNRFLKETDRPDGKLVLEDPEYCASVAFTVGSWIEMLDKYTAS